ncbi:MAG: RidA family protein [Oscillospiraceae bacterium]|nr:RidA family protein [Oscillospiraceae bacterium]
MDIYARLKELGLELPPPPPPGGLYKPVRQSGDMLYVSGQGCTLNGEAQFPGKVGAERTVEEGQEAARVCVLNALSALHHYLGDLNKIQCLIKTQGFVASAEGFTMQPKVVDGASRLLADIWGEEDGVGARTAISAFELPGKITVEIEFIFQLKAE